MVKAVPLAKGKAPKGSRVLVIGDCHAPAMHKKYPDFLARTADELQPDRIVHIGDVADWHAISYHEKNPSLKSPADEFKQAKKQFKRLMEIFPEADWLIGNHDALTHRQASTAGLPPEVIKDYADIWETKWTIHDRFAELIIDDVAYMHGEGLGGKFAHGNRAILRGRSIVMGHLHSNAGVICHANPDKLISGLAVGCGVDNKRLQFLYGKMFPRKPILGCGFVNNGIPQFIPMILKGKTA